MYRYTDKKNKQANQKFAAKQSRQRQTRTRTSESLAAKRSSAAQKRRRSARTGVRATKVKKTVSAAKEAKTASVWPERLASGLAYAGGIAVVLGLMAGIYLMVMNTLLPQFFHAAHEKNILVVGSTLDERAEQLYLIKLEPVSKKVQVRRLPGELDVELIAKYRQYPLASVAPLGYRYSEDLQEVKALYNFALGQVLDELYFVPDLPDVETSDDLQAIFWQLWRDELARTTRSNRDLLDDYFEIRSARFFDVWTVSTLDEITTSVSSLSREKLLECPIALINAAATNGLARRVSGMLEPYGVSVVRWETASEEIPLTQIYYDQSQSDCLKLVQIVQDALPKGAESIADGGALGRKHRVEAVIYLGAELAN